MPSSATSSSNWTIRQASWQTRLQVCLSAAQGDQRRLDRFDLQVHRRRDLHQVVERALIGHGQQRVLMPGVELLGVAGQGFGARAECQISQAAFFEFGEFAADIVRRAGDDPRHAVLAAQRNADPGAGQPLLADERAKGFGQLVNALLGVQRSGFLAPANRSRDDSVAGIFVICGARDEREVQHRAANLEDRAAPFRLLASLAVEAALVLLASICMRWLDMDVIP